MTKLVQLIEDYYKNSPDWPLPVPGDMENEVAEFVRDGDFDASQVRLAIIAFWESEQAVPRD